jgi:hypothetical protein
MLRRVRLAAQLARALVFSLALLGAPAASASTLASNRAALVIGNSEYKKAPRLLNPVQDAKAVAAALQRLGFQVTDGYDLSTEQMRSILRELSTRLAGTQAVVVYYAGHGVSVDEENYLLPIDFDLKAEADLDFNAFSLSLLLAFVLSLDEGRQRAPCWRHAAGLLLLAAEVARR